MGHHVVGTCDCCQYGQVADCGFDCTCSGGGPPLTVTIKTHGSIEVFVGPDEICRPCTSLGLGGHPRFLDGGMSAEAGVGPGCSYDYFAFTPDNIILCGGVEYARNGAILNVTHNCGDGTTTAHLCVLDPGGPWWMSWYDVFDDPTGSIFCAMSFELPPGSGPLSCGGIPHSCVPSSNALIG